jgi:hypothetical protein
LSIASCSASILVDPIEHTVHEFGIEARKPGSSWEAAFNGPIHTWYDTVAGQTIYGVTIRLARLKDSVTRELFSTNLLFYMKPSQMHGIQNVYDLARTTPFTRIRGPRTPAPNCPKRVGKLWYDPNPEGVIMEDTRMTPITLPGGNPGFFVTGQGYRGKVMLPNGLFVHDVGVYGGYLDPLSGERQLELRHLFGGIEFRKGLPGTIEDEYLTELAPGIWASGIVGNAVDEIHIESFKNSVMLPHPPARKTLIGARSMSETKLLYYFETTAADGLGGYKLGGFIDGLPHALGDAAWRRVNRVGLGSNFVECPELAGYLGVVHIVFEKNNPDLPDTWDLQYPEIEEQYEGWMVLLRYNDDGNPVICACIRALTPDDVPRSYRGEGELFDTKRVAFPISLFRAGDKLEVAYGWGDRALFMAEFDYAFVVRSLAPYQRNEPGEFSVCGPFSSL